MNDFDITITATCRPEILDKTLKSFWENMFWPIKPRVVINIDPAGPGDPCKTYDTVGKYFLARLANFPKEPSFPKAFHWCWTNADASYIFHLEDDWELLRKVDIWDMIRIMEINPDLAALRLSKFPAGPTPLDMMKNWNRWVPWNGTFYEVKQDERHRIGVCGHPTLFRGSFVRQMLPFLDPQANPEKQFQGTNPRITLLMPRWRFGVFSKPGDPAYIRDIGRDWMKKNGLHKAGNKGFFTQWEAGNE